MSSQFDYTPNPSYSSKSCITRDTFDQDILQDIPTVFIELTPPLVFSTPTYIPTDEHPVQPQVMWTDLVSMYCAVTRYHAENLAGMFNQLNKPSPNEQKEVCFKDFLSSRERPLMFDHSFMI
ncbi:hypothetical protein L218DRAFT_1010256 [Marasmius fiardii PR-910]|nr:hypothetical protein L218DRAFT_1010256 [Marasmius fiardii PR-910]